MKAAVARLNMEEMTPSRIRPLAPLVSLRRERDAEERQRSDDPLDAVHYTKAVHPTCLEDGRRGRPRVAPDRVQNAVRQEERNVSVPGLPKPEVFREVVEKSSGTLGDRGTKMRTCPLGNVGTPAYGVRTEHPGTPCGGQGTEGQTHAMRFALQHDIVAAVQPLSGEPSESEFGP